MIVRTHGRLKAVAACGAILFLTAVPAAAQTFSLDLGDSGGEATARTVQFIVLNTVLSLAPSILVMLTSFTRIIVVLSFMRQAMGTQQTPPTQVLVSLALFLTLFVMTPTLEATWEQGIRPLIDGEISEKAYPSASGNAI